MHVFIYFKKIIKEEEEEEDSCETVSNSFPENRKIWSRSADSQRGYDHSTVLCE